MFSPLLEFAYRMTAPGPDREALPVLEALVALVPLLVLFLVLLLLPACSCSLDWECSASRLLP
jgi:hypothetical protein